MKADRRGARLRTTAFILPEDICARWLRNIAQISNIYREPVWAQKAVFLLPVKVG